jgi:hypothetical protein
MSRFRIRGQAIRALSTAQAKVSDHFTIPNRIHRMKLVANQISSSYRSDLGDNYRDVFSQIRGRLTADLNF